jgi:hypothetical protein
MQHLISREPNYVRAGSRAVEVWRLAAATEQRSKPTHGNILGMTRVCTLRVLLFPSRLVPTTRRPPPLNAMLLYISDDGDARVETRPVLQVRRRQQCTDVAGCAAAKRMDTSTDGHKQSDQIHDDSVYSNLTMPTEFQILRSICIYRGSLMLNK